VDEENFLDFLSRRSPVFKKRPLPGTRREAIELMLQQPNLIKRPIVVKGRKAVFGFDKEALARLGQAGAR
jgi:arsenate reductase-like glutaredoxin family protein